MNKLKKSAQYAKNEKDINYFCNIKQQICHEKIFITHFKPGFILRVP